MLGVAMSDKAVAKNYMDVFNMSIFPALTVGLPFCVFKCICGIMAIRLGGTDDNGFLTVVGYVVLIWAIIDLLFNICRIVCHAFITR